MIARWPLPLTAILTFIGLILAAENSISAPKCDQSPLQAVFLFDISPTNTTYFARQQQRVIETIKHIDVLTKRRSISFGFVVFHRLPVLLSPLNSPKSGDSAKVTEQVQSVRPRRQAEASPAKALDLAAEQIEKNGREGAKSLVFLVHDGLSTDLIAETLEAVNRLKDQNVEVFVITGSPNPNLLALSGYTHERDRIFAFDSDRIGFLSSVDAVVGSCDGAERETSLQLSPSLNVPPLSQNSKAFFKFDEDAACANSEKVDLMVVLDTSGSVYSVFAEERKLAKNLVESLHPSKFEKNMQVGLVSFASEPSILLPLQHGRSQEAVVRRIEEIEFTGKSTRIADAVQMALGELEARKRDEALQVFVLISDGHGQEYWSQAQSAGRKLQESNAQSFVATTSSDYNLPEMILYAGDNSRVFVGNNTPSFLPVVSKFLNKCVGAERYKPVNNETADNTLIIKLADASGAKVASQALLTKETKPDMSLKTSETETKSIENVTQKTQSSEEKSSEETSAAKKEDLKTRVIQLQEFLNQQKPLHASADCNADIIFVIDRTTRSTFDFPQQLRFASNIAKSIAPVDVDSGKIRLSMVTFSKKARVVIPLGNNHTLADFIAKLDSVQPSRSTGDIEKALASVVDEVEANRRPNARVMVILVGSGKVDSENRATFDGALKQFHGLNNTDTFALSLNPHTDVKSLQEITGDKWRVFVDGRVRRFGNEVTASITSCSLASRESQKPMDSHEADNAIEKIEHLANLAKTLQSKDAFCGPDPVDFVVVFDISTSIIEDFDKQKQLVLNLVKQAPPADLGRRIKLGLTVFNQHASTLISLNNTLSKDEILFAIDRIEHIGGQTSTVTGIGQSLADIQQFRRADATLVVLIVSDGNSKDGWSRVQKAGNILKKSGAEVFAVALSKERNVDELAVYTDSPKRVFSEDKVDLFILSAQKVLFGCAKDAKVVEPKQADIALAEQQSSEVEHIAALDKVVGEAFPKTTTIHPPLTTTENIITTTGKPEYKLAVEKDEEKHIPVMFSDDCFVDLMFVIDKSSSVANEFQKQLQFAVDLVKRLPDDDFENRVNVAAVSFFREAKIEFPFGEMREKSQILDALLAIKFVGGSTSAVSGVKLAVNEIIRGRRKSARLMVVLISDGNSQDPWEEVVDASQSLRDISADVYAVTVSHDYFFRELELYAGNKWFVYIDARIRQFLDEAELSVVECRSPSIPISDKDPAPIGPPTKLQDVTTTLANVSPFPTPSPFKTCQQDIVDLILVLDSSTSVEKEFYAEKDFALGLVKVLPEHDFDSRIRTTLIKFNSKAKLQYAFGEKLTRNDVLYEIERVEHTGGQTSLVSGISLALKQISTKRRPDSRLVTVIISDGNSQDEWVDVQSTAKALKETGSEIYAVTLSEKYYFDELKEYTGNERHIYIDDKIEGFIQEVGMSVVSCPGRAFEKVTLAPTAEVSVTPTTLNNDGPTSPVSTVTEKPEKGEDLAVEAAEPQFALARDASPEVSDRMEAQGVPHKERCKYSKMDLIIILDASSSRESVFEHQRELALSLIERLPISSTGTHVATGLNSFTSSPVLRQTLGLGRDKLMVRHAIEDIKYRGGSTLTSKAVELAVKDLERGKRPDALQVVVLLNDGMSQDPWDKVLMASESLAATGAERFGVALGEDVDLRELRHYIANDSRIYRDGSTERFLSDVVSLLNGGERDCPSTSEDTDDSGFEPSAEDCSKPKLDIIIAFDATENAKDSSKVSSNKYLLLDVLGSLPANDDVKVGIFAFGEEAKLVQEFSDPKFETIEAIQPIHGKPSYAKAVRAGLDI